MRNLKRALSLALASVMLLGMMVVGAGAASYPDVDANDNVEAIEVLNAIKVMIGKQGNFEPDSSVNRHEMAVIMAKLVLGNEAADKYVGTHPFTDVVPWADKYVAACYENGLVAGTSATTFGGSKQLTAVEAAAMMLRALGYKDLSKGATDWRVPVTAAANRIRLFADVASTPSEKLTRNQVAQLALNTLKSPMVDTKDGLSITGSNGDVSFTISGGQEYVVRSSTDTRISGAILSNETAGNGADGLSGLALELGEHLYNGKLRLRDSEDDFGRPARHWEYDGKVIGDYAKKELARATYTDEVKGGRLYDDIGSEACDYDLEYWVDGKKKNSADTKIEADKLVRRNDKAIGSTGNGVLTEVYVNTQEKELTIVEIHTYLAQATADYNSSNERLSVKVWTGRDTSPVKRLELADLPNIVGYEKDDYMMVTMANGVVKSVADPALVADAYVSAYSARPDEGQPHGDDTKGGVKQVTADGKVYKTSKEAYHDSECLYDYTLEKLKDHRYDLYLDSYGYLLGIKEVSSDENFFFVVGYKPGSVLWGSALDKANVIFPDGTMAEVNAKVKSDAEIYGLGNNGNADINTWYNYSVNADGVYEISGRTNRQFAETRAATAGSEEKIDSSNTTMATTYEIRHDVKPAAARPTYVYGNDASVYIAVKAKTVNSVDRIDEVTSVTTGIKNVSIVPKAGVLNAAAVPTKYNVFGLYNSSGYVTYAVVIGEDGSVADNLVYLTSGITGSYYDTENSQYVWQYDAITKDSDDVVTVNSTVKFDVAKSDLAAHNLYKASYDAKGFITKMEKMNAEQDGTTATYNTKAYKDYGYGLKQVAASAAAQKITLSGNMLFLTVAGNDEYVVTTGETRFFVNNTDDPGNGYELYSDAASALAALGKGKELTATATDFAQFVTICDKTTGFAKTVIFLDRVYEEDASEGGPVDARIDSIYFVNGDASAMKVAVEMTANVDEDTTFDFVVYRITDEGKEVPAADGKVTVSDGTNVGTSENLNLPAGYYRIVVGGNRSNIIPVR